MSAFPLISLRQVRIGVGRTVLFHDLSWDLKAGEHWIISGNCGVGKSVLAEFMANQHRLVSGSRNYSLFPNLSVSEQLQRGLKLISFTDTGDLFLNYRNVHYYQQRFNAFDSEGHLTVRDYFEKSETELANYQGLLARMGLDKLLAVERIKLSSGQTRKMLLAKVMMSQPKVLILDNAYIGLDKGMRHLLNQVLDELVEESGMSLILAGHHRELPHCISHQLHIHSDGPIQQGQIPLPLPSPSPIIQAKALEKIREYFQQKYSEDSYEEMIRMDDVSIQYGSNTLLHKLNWSVKPGEKWAVYGPNGSGKSTLLSLIYADNPQAYSKEIYLFDKKRGSGESIWEIKARIGFTSPELHAYFRENPTAQQLVFTGLTDTFFLKRNPHSQEQALSDLLFTYFDIEDEKERYFKQLSTGTQRLLLFMRALMKAPPVLLLDEPFQGMDEEMVIKCKHLLDQVLNERHTLLFISHYKEEWPTCVDQVLELGGGLGD